LQLDSESEAASVVRDLWRLIQQRDWHGAGQRLSEDIVVDWPQTRERFRGRDNFIAMNRAHPAPNWRIEILNILALDSAVAVELRVPDDETVHFCVGFYRVDGDAISHIREFWIEEKPQEPPIWRRQWTESF
jgi:hypothetical protein